jgi:anti-sigma factor RsiW
MKLECSYEKWLGSYHDGQLSEPQQREIAAHVATCHSCASELRQLSELTRLIASAPRPAISQIAMARLHHGVDAISARSLLRLTQALSGIAAAMLVAASLWLTQARPTPGTVVDSASSSWESAALAPVDSQTLVASNSAAEATEWMLARLSSRRATR